MLENITHYTLLILITLIVLDISHVPLTIFSFIGGTLAISVGLGSQKILNNVLSGLIIIIERPIRLGDLIEIDKSIGRVTKIGVRSVNVRTNSNIDILIPNSAMIENKVINWTLSDEKVRLSITIPLQQNTPTRIAEKVILDSLVNYDQVLKLPKPSVYFEGYLEAELILEVNFWVNINNCDRKQVVSDVNHLINAALFKAKLIN